MTGLTERTRTASVTAQVAYGDALINALPQPVMLILEDGAIAFVNQAAQAFFHAGAPSMTGQPVAVFLPFGSAMLSVIDKARSDAAPVIEYALDLTTPRTGPRTADIQASPVPESPGAVLVVLLERTIAQKMDRQFTSRGAARSITSMAAVLAHEVKNPLAGIRGAAQLLEQNASPDDRTLTRLICDETDRICKLVDRMEIFSERRPLERKPVNIHAVLNHVRRVAQAGFARDLRILEVYDPSLPPVPGDHDQLVQVFLNLVKNAADATPPGDGEIQLTTAFRPGVRVMVPGAKGRVSLPLEVCVKDNGVGVPADLLPHMFDPFVTTKPSGTGLGLALVAKILGDHGGVIECESQPRRTVFRVLLPMSQEEAEE